MITTYELYTNENGTPKAVEGKAPAIIERVEALETGVTGLQTTLDGKADTSYVDAGLAEKQPVGDYATNAQLTAGLAGKEDRGTCLPLEQGGKLTKSSEGHDPYIGCATSDSIMRIWGGSVFEDGASLYLSGKDCTTDPSTFRLYANDGVTYKSLEGRPDGTLIWDGNHILRLSGESILSNGYVRFSNGLQLCWSSAINKKTVNFSAPFKGGNIRVVGTHMMGSTTGDATSMGIYTTATGIYTNDGTSHTNNASAYIAIGDWK